MCARRVIYKPSTPEERKLVGLLHNMVVRCHCKTSPRYYDYGGRGISVCSEWYDSENGKYHNEAFVKWALANGYREGLQIDRIDNNGNYSPDNCRFITAQWDRYVRQGCLQVLQNRLCRLHHPHKTRMGSEEGGYDTARIQKEGFVLS